MSFKIFILFLFSTLLVVSNQIYAQSPTSAAQRFNVFVKGDVNLKANEAGGAIAVGGNLTTSEYDINFESNHGVYFVGNASIGLAVRGAVNLASGTLKVNGTNYVKIGNCSPNSSAGKNLKVWYKDGTGAETTIRITEETKGHDDKPNILLNAQVGSWNPKVGENQNPICENVFGTAAGQIDIDGAFTKLISRSNQLAGLTDNLAIRDQNGNLIPGAEVGPYLNPNILGNNPKIIVDPSKINVLTVSAEVWNSISNSNIERVPQAPAQWDESYSGPFGLIVNIVNFPAFAAANNTTTVKFPGFGGLSDGQGSYIIYNFPDANDALTVGGSNSIYGTILAPKAKLTKDNSSNIYGQIISETFDQNRGKVLYWPYLPSIAEPAIAVNASTKCLLDAPYLDYSITPNFNTSNLAKIEWLNPSGQVVFTNTNQPLTGSILFPGAATDTDGKGIAWPGWEMQGGKWVQINDLLSTIRETGAKVRITVNPTKTVDISYPPSTPGCLTNPPPPTVLPVTLSGFTARNENCTVALKWTVTEAKDFSHFEVQRSSDAKAFTTLSEVQYEASKKEYNYSDSPYNTEASASKNFYYRLKQVDNDNSFEYSSIRSVEAGQCDARLAVSFYPNPTQDEVNVKSFSPVKLLEILTVGGKLVYKTLPSQNQTEVNVNVKELNQGLYIVNIVNSEGKYSSKILKK